MGVEQIIQCISSVGFPIFACIVMFKQIEELRKTIESNTKVMIKICSILKIDEEEEV